MWWAYHQQGIPAHQGKLGSSCDLFLRLVLWKYVCHLNVSKIIRLNNCFIPPIEVQIRSKDMFEMFDWNLYLEYCLIFDLLVYASYPFLIALFWLEHTMNTLFCCISPNASKVLSRYYIVKKYNLRTVHKSKCVEGHVSWVRNWAENTKTNVNDWIIGNIKFWNIEE